MAKVTVNAQAPTLTPSQEAVAKASKTVVVTDDLGRKLLLRKPGILGQYRIISLLGPQDSANDRYVGMVMPLLWVQKIDDEDVEFPAHKSEIEVLVKRLGEEGIAAIVEGIEDNWGAPRKGADVDDLKK